MTLEEALRAGGSLRRKGHRTYRANNSNVAAHLWVKTFTLTESAWLEPAILREFIWLDISDLMALDWEVKSDTAG